MRVPLLVVFALGCQGTIGTGSDPLDRPAPFGERDDVDRPPDDEPPPRPSLRELFECASPGTLPPRIVRLNARQYAETVRVALGITPDEGVPFDLVNAADRFSTLRTSYRVGEGDVETVVLAASSLAERAVQRWIDEGDSCLRGVGRDGFDGCIREELRARGAVLFHRPLSGDELERYARVGDSGAGFDASAWASTSFEAMLRSPEFLFRTELAEGGRLDPFEIAAALSYTLTDGPPDEALWRAAEDGLSTAEDVRTQVERLMAAPAESDVLLRFVREYFGYGAAPLAGKSTQEFPNHDGDALVADTDRFVRHVLDGHGRAGFLRELLTSDVVFTQASTAWNYGLEVPGSAPVQMRVPGERAGILLQPAWLVAWSEPDKNQPIQRGKFIRESFLCQDLPALPIPEIDPLGDVDGRTLREILASHRASPACAGCHDQMDPLGLPFEQFDHVGRFRTMEQGRPVETHGALDSSGTDTDGEVSDPIDLTQRLAESGVVRQCFVAHAFEYWIGEKPSGSVGCALADADGAFAEGQDLVGLVAAFFASDAFLLRTEESP
ncbi:MAG: DUF1588 domain-containing protein [Myxococcota bacterium]